MKTILLLLFSGFLHPVTHDTGPDDILGIWMNQSGKGQIQIYKDGDKYAGKVIWLKEPNNNNGHSQTRYQKSQGRTADTPYPRLRNTAWLLL